MIISYWDPEQKVIHLFIKFKKTNYKRRCLSFNYVKKKDPTFLYLKVMISSFFFFIQEVGVIMISPGVLFVWNRH